MLLRLGANPNGIGLLPGVKDRSRKDFLTRPLDILLNNDTNRMWRRNWQSAAPILYRCVKPLIEHGASTSPAPYASDPIRILLDNIWRFLCPVARHAAKVGKKGQTTISQLLDALLTTEVDIRPLDKLCDIVVDANPEYTRRSKGLRGKERLVRLLRQRKDALPLSFYWKSRDLWVFKAKRRHPKYDHINDQWVLSKRQHGHSRYIYYEHESESDDSSESDDYSESDDDDEEYEDEEHGDEERELE
ncbi:hypothetical protein F4821DRAFT_259570 [Hypoxylon rubiginosum]|uniref:Uncharacterized protein n=1 Tax=Hypoxylon rubiginosum TaxID=110542 RepID=A0ACC0D2S1_9PEZI|nr:hypothetical protein F4821DRAFT_259570 [Hypoxylon rubiginosum]